MLLSKSHVSFLKGFLPSIPRATFGRVRDNLIQLKTKECNVPQKIIDLVDRNLMANPNHPLGILANKIKEFFTIQSIFKSRLQEQFYIPYTIRDDFSPIVTPQENFDDLQIPLDHISRKKTDTYYISKFHLLRTHTSAHQKKMITSGNNGFVIFGDVYRRDQIDSTHYPIFHQVVPSHHPKDNFSSLL